VNKEQKQFDKVIKARRSHERRIRRVKSGWTGEDRLRTSEGKPILNEKRIEVLSLWRRIINWILRKL